jgi:hypothetical protein
VGDDADRAGTGGNTAGSDAEGTEVPDAERADADEAGASGPGLANMRGPFCPHAASTAAAASQEHTIDAAFTAGTTLNLRCNITGFYRPCPLH